MAKSLTDLAKAMKDIDFTMFCTKTEGGQIAARPMSNNRDVDFDGDSWFFSSDDTRLVSDIGKDASVTLTLQGAKSLLGKPGIFIAIEGNAELIRDKAAFAEHWTKDLERWYTQGVDSPGLVLIKVHAHRIHYWDGEDQGEIRP